MSKTTITHPDGTRTVIQRSGGLGCVGILAILLVIGACVQMPILIPLTIVALAVMFTIHSGQA